MTDNFKKKIALVTGCTSGLGKEISISLAKEGANIVLCARNESTVKTTIKEIENLGVKVLGLSVDPVSDHVKWLEDIKDVDSIIHLAALSNDPLGEFNPELTEQINVSKEKKGQRRSSRVY